MDLNFSPEDLAFGDEVRAFINEAFDDEMRDKLAQSKNHHLDKASQVRWLKRLGEKGWMAPDWPVEHGGTGWSLSKKYVFDMEMALAGAPSTSNMGTKMCAPVVMAFGTDEQKSQHLSKILTTDVWWCQGYSEPGSGSDLASLSMKAVRDGDHYVLNGSKTWTTLAQWADWMFCLVRTSREDRQQKGISFLLIDMKSPGVKVRPILTMDHCHDVNEVFLDRVRVPLENLVGKEGDGWTYAKVLLSGERVLVSEVGRSTRQLRRLEYLAQNTSKGGQSLAINAAFARRFAELKLRLFVLRATCHQAIADDMAGVDLGAEASLMKLRGSELQQDIAEAMVDALGLAGIVYDARDLAGMGEDPGFGPFEAPGIIKDHLHGRAASIYGGSNEIQRNIMAKQALGL